MFLFAFALTLLASSSAFGAATIVVQPNDPANVGFNDPTPVSPVGDNNGTTLGQQRLIAVQRAADIWGAVLTSGPTITVRANWPNDVPCTATTAVLASAGTVGLVGNFANAPFANTWYSRALANKLAGTDLSAAGPEIDAEFNSRIGTSGCLPTRFWYLGLDNNHGAGIDLVTVTIHELGHGLGFASFTNEATGAQPSNRPSIFDRFLRDNTTGKLWPDMTDSERVASAINFRNLVWIGSQVTADVPNIPLSGGADGSNHALLFTPNPVDPGSSVSHWDTSLSPNQLMEPNISSNLSHSVAVPQDLTLSLLTDIGWGSSGPPASPTPTPSPPPNDNFANAQVISGCSGTVTGTNIGATHEAGEPNHLPDGSGGTHSVWYQWQAPVSASVNFTTSGSNYDTALGIYTGNAVNSLSVIGKNDDVDPGVIQSSTLTFNAVAGTVYKIAVDGFDDDTGSIQLNWSTANCTASVQLGTSSASVNEGGGTVNIAVNRAGSTGSAATVNYSTNDIFNAVCSQNNGQASANCDYNTAGGTLRFAAGEISKNITLSIVNDGYVEGNETFTLTLSNPSGMTLGATTTTTITIVDNDATATNPFDNNGFFVRQQYLDFLLREPDAGGFNDWLNVLNNCQPNQGGLGSDPACDRVHVSSGFFRSTEFGERGYWSYRYYHAALGRRPQFAEFVPDMRRLSGFLSPAEEEAQRAAFVADFMQRGEFQAIYGGLTSSATAAQFIAKLEEKAGVTLPATTTTLPGQPPQYGRNELIQKMASGEFTAAQTLRAFIEQKVVFDAFFFRAFVAMQYFGYLLRDPDDAGYNDWVDVLTNGRGTIPPGDFRHLIFGFVWSVEYRQRFGP